MAQHRGDDAKFDRPESPHTAVTVEDQRSHRVEGLEVTEDLTRRLVRRHEVRRGVHAKMQATGLRGHHAQMFPQRARRLRGSVEQVDPLREGLTLDGQVEV